VKNLEMSVYLSEHLYTEARSRSKTIEPQLRVEVSRGAPGESVIQALHHHGAGGVAMVTVEAQ